MLHHQKMMQYNKEYMQHRESTKNIPDLISHIDTHLPISGILNKGKRFLTKTRAVCTAYLVRH